jgi:hypothetical protein
MRVTYEIEYWVIAWLRGRVRIELLVDFLGGGLPLKISHDPVHETFPFGRYIFVVEFGQFPQQLLLSFAEFLRNFDECLNEQIPLGSRMRIGHSLTPQSEHGTALRSSSDIEGLATFERRDLDTRTQGRLAEGNRQLQDEVVPIPFEDRVGFDVNKAIGVTSRPAIWTRLSLALQANAHVVVDPRGNFDFEFYLVRL